MNADGFIRRLPDYDWSMGFFQPLQSSFGYPLRVEQMHSKIGKLDVQCDFPLAWLPIWSNANTFSFEPYFHSILKPGLETSWAIRYIF